MDQINSTEPKKGGSSIITIFIVLILIILAFVAFGKTKDDKNNDDAMMEDSSSMMEDEEKGDAMMEDDKGSMMESSDSMIKEDSASMENDNMMAKSGSYEMYSEEKLAMAEKGDVVIFFKASWCPTCRALDADIKANMGNIPESLTILETDYDKSTDLRKKYGVTTQHTLVQVDKDGNLINKWTGSPDLKALVSSVK